jgi:hypothetical protein
MAKKKRVDPVKQREKRVKIAAIVGTVLMVLVGAYEIPSMLAVMNKKPPGNTRYDPGPSLTPGGLPNVAAGAGGSTAAAAPSGQLVDTDAPPASGAGQLVSFSVFETKNPFYPQVSNAQAPPDTGAGTSTTPTTANKPGADVPATTNGTTTNGTTTTATPPGASAVPSTQPPGTTTTTAAPPPPTVSLSVNGAVSHVASGGTFPSGTPVFRLTSWTKGSAQIAIVGGSYASGTGTLTLHVGEAVTLENQTDGKRYTLELLST